MKKSGFALGFADKTVPCGTHIAVLYEKEAELIGIYSKYFARGLKNDEICVVFYEDEGFRKKLEDEISKIFPIEKQDHNRRVEFVRYKDFYLNDGKFDSSIPIRLIDKKLEDNRYMVGAGIRVLGVTSQINSKEFDDVIHYERALTDRYFKESLIISCAYPTKSISIPNLVKILQSHTLVLYKEQGKWKMSETVERDKMRTEINSLEQFTKFAVGRELKMAELKEKIRRLEESRK
jgi:hypothetical protein